MAFFSLPNEIIIDIVENLDKEQDIYSLIRVSRRLYDLFDDYLYCHNIKHRRCSALFWAAEHGRESTARKLLHQGADVNVKVQKAKSNGNGPQAGLTPLHLAAEKGHLAMVKLLLEVGADPEARVQERLTPLFFALTAKHEKIARTISRRISNVENCSVDSTKRLTPLHVSCRLGLWGCARYFLNEGADVDATDTSAMTPLHHALLQRPSPLELGCDLTIPRIDIGGGKSHPGPDAIFETAKVLVEFGANHNLESRPRSVGEKPISARELGANHPYDRVRALFSDCAGDSLHNISKNKLYSLQIGRTWMRPSHSETSGTEHDGPNLMKYTNTERLFNNYDSGRTSDGDQRQPENLDLSSFPVLDNTHQPHISSSKTHVSDGPWSPAKIDSLIASFDESDTPPIIEQSAQVNRFPHLNSHISKIPLETEAGKLWADFGKPKGHPVAEEMFFSSANSEKNSVSETKHTKMRGKNRWQPLKI